MARSKAGTSSAKKHRRVLKTVRGFRGVPGRLYRAAIAANMRAGRFATFSRKIRKRDFRSLWIVRISAACRARGVSYSRFIAGLDQAGIVVNRKMLSEVAIADPAAFDKLVEAATGKAVAAAQA